MQDQTAGVSAGTHASAGAGRRARGLRSQGTLHHGARQFGAPGVGGARGGDRAPGPAFAPVVREVGGGLRGAVAEFSRRDAPEVLLRPPEHLMCVNFHTVREAVYRYAGGPEVRGVRHAGCAHLIAAGHEIWGHTPGPTDHVVFKLPPARVRALAAATFGRDDVDLATDGVPFFDARLFQLATLLRDELAADTPGGPLAVESLTTLVSVHLLRTRSTAARAGGAGAPPALPGRVLRRVVEYVDAHFAGPLTLGELARVAGLSEYHFLRLFRAATGRTPRQYVIDRRVRFVREQLAAARPPALSTVSLAAGFSSQSHMTRAFRARLGVTPDAFRRAVG